MKVPFLAIVAFAVFAGAQDKPDDTLVFTSYEMGITFNYPNTWETATAKGSTTMRFPVEGSTRPATLEIFSANFRSEIDIWLISQKTVSEQMHRQVVRQWQEEVMGVPLLLTRSTGMEGEIPTTILSGLVYSATSRKLVFRLAADTADFDKAEYMWRTAMQSMRTLDGTLPKPEDPNRPVTEADLRPLTKPPTRLVIKPVVPDPEKFVKGPVVQSATVGGKQVTLRAPSGWSFETAEGGFFLKNSAKGLSATLSLASTLDSPPPAKALMVQSGKSLNSFTMVDERIEKGPKFSASGCSTAYVWRTGRDDAGSRWGLDAVGQMGDSYWTLVATQTGTLKEDQRRLLMELIDVLSIEFSSP